VTAGGHMVVNVLRNLSPPNISYGTRLLIKELCDNIIVAIILGDSSGTACLYSADTHDSDGFANIVQKAEVSSQSFIYPHHK